MPDIKFGTSRAVNVTETLGTMCADLQFRLIGESKVSDYDQSRYGSEEELKKFIRENCVDIIERCVNLRFDEENRINMIRKKLGPAFDNELSDLGITAETTIVSYTLSEESDKKYKEMLAYVLRSDRGDCMWDRMNFDDVNRNKSNIPGFISNNPMVMNMLDGPGMVNKQPVEPVYYKERWRCPNCGANDNHGRFCPNCGTPKPEDPNERLKDGEWRCVCGCVNTGRFCCACGRAKENQ